MMIHPKFNPIAIKIDPIAIRWYALSYIVGFMLFLWLGRRRIKQGNTAFTKEMLDDFLGWGAIGVILGGRLGYILFYKFSYYLEHPLDMIKVWEGGMSFHGGFLGVVIAMWIFSRQHKIQQKNCQSNTDNHDLTLFGFPNLFPKLVGNTIIGVPHP